MTKREVAVLSNQQTGVMEVHDPDCRDVARKLNTWGVADSSWAVPVGDGEDILRACQLDLAASGFASDHGLTPEQYVDEGFSHEFKVYNCCKKEGAVR